MKIKDYLKLIWIMIYKFLYSYPMIILYIVTLLYIVDSYIEDYFKYDYVKDYKEKVVTDNDTYYIYDYQESDYKVEYSKYSINRDNFIQELDDNKILLHGYTTTYIIIFILFLIISPIAIVFSWLLTVL